MTSKRDGDCGSRQLGIGVGEDFVYYAGVTGNLRVGWGSVGSGALGVIVSQFGV